MTNKICFDNLVYPLPLPAEQDLPLRSVIPTDAEQLAALFSSAPVPLFARDVEGRYIACNQAFSCFLGIPEEDLLGSSVFDIGPEELAIRYHRADLALLQEGGVQTYENLVQCVDGRRAQVRFTKRVFFDADGKPAGIIGSLVDLTEQKAAEQALLCEMHYDPLTGLVNRRHLEQRLTLLLSEPDQAPLAVLAIDIDRFKLVNETLGHALGNRLLQCLAQKLAEVMRSCDLLSRSSRDEFILVLPKLIHRQYVDYIIARIWALLSAPFELDGHQIYCPASIGVALAPEDGDTTADLLQKAETAQFQAQSQGKNQCRFYHQAMAQNTAERLALETALRGAIRKEQLFLHFQPQVDLQSGRIAGVEALARWRHELWGNVPPGRFIPIAEGSGLIIPLGEWVLRTACRQAKAWQEAGLPAVRMAVNVSSHQFQQGGFVDLVAEILNQTGLDPAYLELELTESAIMERTEENIGTLHSLKTLGVQLTIDDFGTGYSSLAYLKRFPIDRVKIDRSFVCNLPDDPDDAAITDAVIALAHSLRYQVTAEGVETAEQLAYLRQRNCDEMQGFYFGKPVSAAEIAGLLKWGKPLA